MAHFSTTPVNVIVQLTEFGNIRNTLNITKSGGNIVHEGKEAVFSVNLGALPYNTKWNLNFVLNYNSFSVKSSITNFSK